MSREIQVRKIIWVENRWPVWKGSHLVLSQHSSKCWLRLLLQFWWGAAFDDFPIAEDQNGVTVQNAAHTMLKTEKGGVRIHERQTPSSGTHSNSDDGLPFEGCLHHSLNQPVGCHVDRRGGFIQDENLGVLQKCTSQAEELPREQSSSESAAFSWERAREGAWDKTNLSLTNAEILTTLCYDCIWKKSNITMSGIKGKLKKESNFPGCLTDWTTKTTLKRRKWISLSSSEVPMKKENIVMSQD